jgi:molybdopterin molybdotransferase
VLRVVADHRLSWFNRRLEQGEQGRSLVAWLNSLPEVRAVLAAEFAGKPIREQNLPEWRQHGFTYCPSSQSRAPGIRKWTLKTLSTKYDCRMISLAAARALIAEKISPLPAVSTPLAGALGRVLRQEVRATEDLPGFDRSAMDGYAIAAEDPTAHFRIVAEIQAGALARFKIRRGECARILTGAPIPTGASQVLPQEHVRVENNIMVPLDRHGGSHIRRRGEDARKGDLLLQPGIRLGAGELALLASLGVTRLKLSPRLRVAHIATGNELVAPGQKLRRGQIRDANSTLVAALIGQFGGEVVHHELVADDFDLLLGKARALRKSFDLLLLSGGASVGEYDFGKQLLTALGFQIHFTAIHLRPGRPLVFATRGRQAAFVLPGNPVSHLVTLHVAVRLACDQFLAANPAWPLVNLRLAEAFEVRPGGRETFWPARVEVQHGGLVVRALRWQSSGDVTGLAGGNALVQLAAGTAAPRAGDDVSVLMLELP